MKFFRLDTSYLPSNTVQNFESLAWVERYQTAGDFQLVVKNEINILNTLPLGALVSHTDTKEVMIVENHEFDRKSKKSLDIIVSGRSFETFAENRVTGGSTAGDAAAVAVFFMSALLEPGTASSDEAIPNLSIYADMRDPDTSMTHNVKTGSLYTRTLELLQICGAGIKIIRPNGVQTTLDLVVHDGEDLIGTVIFYAQNEDLENAKYFWSLKGYKNYTFTVYNDGANSRVHRHRDILTNLTGFERRVMYVDANDLIGTFTPPSASDVVSARSQSALDEHKKLSLIQATISDRAKPKFKLDYNMGDLVTVFGEFGAAQAMRVTEHILTVDKKGMRGYPSLSILE